MMQQQKFHILVIIKRRCASPSADGALLRARQKMKMIKEKVTVLRFPLEVTRLDRIMNRLIRETARVRRLGDKAREARWRWFGRVWRRVGEYAS